MLIARLGTAFGLLGVTPAATRQLLLGLLRALKRRVLLLVLLQVLLPSMVMMWVGLNMPSI